MYLRIWTLYFLYSRYNGGESSLSRFCLVFFFPRSQRIRKCNDRNLDVHFYSINVTRLSPRGIVRDKRKSIRLGFVFFKWQYFSFRLPHRLFESCESSTSCLAFVLRKKCRVFRSRRQVQSRVTTVRASTWDIHNVLSGIWASKFRKYEVRSPTTLFPDDTGEEKQKSGVFLSTNQRFDLFPPSPPLPSAPVAEG